MSFNKQQIRDAYKKFSEEVQSFVTSSETSDLIESYINETNIITVNNRDLADSEIFWATLRLQSLDEAIENISKVNNKSAEEFSVLKNNLEKNVFKKIEDINNVPAPLVNTSEIKAPAADNAVVETVRSLESLQSINQADEPKKNIVEIPNYSNYDSGKDPYREPVE